MLPILTSFEPKSAKTIKPQEKNKNKEDETSVVDYAREKVRSITGGISGPTSTATTIGSSRLV